MKTAPISQPAAPMRINAPVAHQPPTLPGQSQAALHPLTQWQRFTSAWRSTWHTIFSPVRHVNTGNTTFRIDERPLGRGTESITYRILDENDLPTNRVLKHFLLDAGIPLVHGSLPMVRHLPKGYVQGWANRLQHIEDLGHKAAKVFGVHSEYAEVEFIDGITFKQLGRAARRRGWSRSDVDQIRAAARAIAQDIISRNGPCDGLHTCANMLFMPATQQWVIIDA